MKFKIIQYLQLTQTAQIEARFVFSHIAQQLLGFLVVIFQNKTPFVCNSQDAKSIVD